MKSMVFEFDLVLVIGYVRISVNFRKDCKKITLLNFWENIHELQRLNSFERLYLATNQMTWFT